VTAPSGTIRHDFCLAVEVSRLAAGPASKLKIFAASQLARAHDSVPGIRDLGTWFTIRYRGGRFRVYVARQSDVWVLLEVLGWGTYDHPELPEPRTILDLGSHIGTSLLHFRATYPNARIIGIEPNPETFKRLSRNAARLGVEVHQVAVAPTDGPIDFYPQWNALLASTRRSGSGVEAVVVEGRTLDTLRDELGLSTLDLLKIDIEAGETAVLASARDVPVIVGELHDERDSEAREKLRSLFDGFELRFFQEDLAPHPTFAAVRRDSLPTPSQPAR
jgi:FkbM family methyltransferase